MVIDFKDVNEKGNWLIINDGVMGGLSNSEIVFKNSGTVVSKERFLWKIMVGLPLPDRKHVCLI